MKKMIVSLAMFLFCAVFLLSGCDKEPTWQEFYDAGIQASEEENYEEAIVAFEEAIALDASRPEAYAALADVYLAKEDLEQALEVLQRGVEATNDETLKARVEEITVKLEELAGPQKPEYMVEYLGMTVNEIAALWGEDYTVAPDLYLGGAKGIYYEDGRLPATFYFQDIFNNGVQTGKERIDLIEISSDLTIAEGFFPALTRPELESTHPEGEFAFFEESGNGATYTCKYNDNISIIYGWEYGDDPEMTPAPWITLYMEGLDVQLDEESLFIEEDEENLFMKEEKDKTMGETDSVVSNVTMSSHGGVWYSTFVGTSSPMPKEEVVITDITDGIVTFDMRFYRLTRIDGQTATFITENTAEFEIPDGYGRIVFEPECVKLYIDYSNSSIFSVGTPYVFQTRGDKSFL